MKSSVSLPIVEPVYGTYHYQGAACAIIHQNPSIRNWYLNQVMLLQCERRFLDGFTTPLLTVWGSSWTNAPYIEYKCYATKHMKTEYMQQLIQTLLSEGYYVIYGCVDDYYIPGKTWYHEKHFLHDGLICGYDQKEQTYQFFAYDQRWKYRVFTTTQSGFCEGWKAGAECGKFHPLCGLRPTTEQVRLRPMQILRVLHQYLDSSLEKYPEHEQGLVFGSVVHTYLSMYLGKLYDGSIPYERMDWRVFRLIWEQKRLMLERLETVENTLHLDHESSTAYAPLVQSANEMRMLYASHHKRRRDSVLPLLQQKLKYMQSTEEEILFRFTKKMERCLP